MSMNETQIKSKNEVQRQVIEVLNYPLYANNLEKLNLEKKIVINTINQYSYCIAEEDEDFKSALKESDILLPDGIGIIWAVKMLLKKKIKKIAGADMHMHLLKQLQKTNGSCFYLGSSEETLKKIKSRLAKEYGNISVATYSPPFKPQFDDADVQAMIREVNAFSPDVLFVGMTAPKQEKWSQKYKEQINAKVICSIGAVFDFYAGTVERPNKIWINLGLEWFIRLVNEPKRMWRRYLLYGPLFIYHILKEKFNKPKFMGNLAKTSLIFYNVHEFILS